MTRRTSVQKALVEVLKIHRMPGKGPADLIENGVIRVNDGFEIFHTHLISNPVHEFITAF